MPDLDNDDHAHVASIARVAVIGAGVLGPQIAFQAALHGYSVAVHDTDSVALAALPAAFEKISGQQRLEVGADPAALRRAVGRVQAYARLDEAVADSDLVVETVAERLDVKAALLADLSALLPERTIVASNSSGFVPSQLAERFTRPEQYLHMHFANRIWLHNIAEIMGGPLTLPVVCTTTVEFARSIGMIPIVLQKEHRGYVGNSLLSPLLDAAMRLLIDGIADVETIDKNWMITRETPFGPFATYDYIGFRTMLLRAETLYEQDPSDYNAKVVDLWRGLIAEGKLGEASGEGFYSYPNPAWSRPDFLV